MLRFVLVALLAGCFADESQLSGGNVCRAGAGWYCGFDGVPGDQTHLYYCPPGSTAESMALDVGRCPQSSCEHDTIDHCLGGSSMTQAFGNPGYGWWCGQAFDGGTPGNLYFFTDGGPGAELGKCPQGCIVAGKNDPDYCL
jgi:hypothetical protein